jgi:hypothetical protein
MEMSEKNNVLDSYMQIIPYLYLLFDDDIAVSMCDTEKYIKLEGTAVKMGIPVSRISLRLLSLQRKILRLCLRMRKR